MRLRDRVNQDLTAAMKARDAGRLSTLRMMKTAIRNREVELRAELDDAQSVQVLVTLVKQRKDSIEQFTRGGRTDLAAKEAAEITVIESYMPAAASEEEIGRVVAEVVEALDAKSPKDLGAVMKECMSRFSGRPVDGKKVNVAVRRRLETGSDPAAPA
ncbi:MAG: GatB/YqeY domain-containing protein [Acidobacteriota bacterium]